MLRWIACLSLALFASTAFAGIPTLTVEGDDGNVALALSAVSIRVTVRGHLARTEYELTYRNSLDRETGGTFSFPLPPDAEVSDLGLWFDGVLRHGVAVERVLARTAYDETVHRGVDPALVEWNAGRLFHLNVFPIPPQGEKKVFFAYDQELTNADYVLDVSYRSTVPSFDVKVDSDAGWPVEKDGMLRISRDVRETALTARSSEDGLWYASAAVDFTPESREAMPAPQVVILYDTSSSSVQQKAPVLRRFLRDFLVRQQAWATTVVLPFHVDLDEPHRIEKAGTPGGASELDRVLDGLQPLGATNLLAVVTRLPKLAASLPPGSRIVLVTDGLSSLGDSHEVAAAVAKLATLGRPLLVVHATETANDELLDNAARVTGGWKIDLLRIDPDAAIDEAMHVPTTTRLAGDEMVPAAIMTSRASRFAIAARTTNAMTVLALPGRELPLHEVTGPTEASMVRRAWARAKLRDLMAGSAPDDDLIAHGRAFTQLTPRTSLLVLESWWDYAQYGIPLPPDLAEEKQKWEEEQARLNVARSARAHAPLPPPVITNGGWSIKGRVLDSSGVPLPGVTVILEDGDVAICSSFTNVDGWYVLGSAVPPNAPRVIAELSGFNPTTRSLPSPTPSGGTLDLTLQFPSVSESITVTASAPILETQAVQSAGVSASLRTAVVSTDNLLSILATETPSDDPDLRAEAMRHRRELTEKVTSKLRAIVSPSERLRYYLAARGLLGGDKGFHVFAAQAFRERSPEVAARVLSDLAEARPDDAPLLRILARILGGWGEDALARLLLERAIEISPTEPQSWRELILLEARQGRPARVASLTKRLKAGKQRDWMNEAYQQIAEVIGRWDKASFLEHQRGVELRASADDDLTIELMFDNGWCYVDQHVHEPGGEVVTWNHTTSKNGATFTGGYTFGYGPEIYTLPRAPRGQYQVMLDYWSVDDTEVSLETLVHVIVQARGKRSEYVYVLSEEKENLLLTTVEMK